MSAPAAEPHTAAVEAVLTAAGLRVGRGKRPPGGGWQGEPGRSNFAEYVILWPTSGIPFGSLGDPASHLDYQFQATCVGATQEQAETVADQVRAAVVGQRIPVPGRSSAPAFQLLQRLAERDDSVKPGEHYVVAQYQWESSPA